MDLTTDWLGLTLENPFVPSASPLSRSLDAAKQLEDAGAPALVMYSLFEEAVTIEDEGMVRFIHHQDHGHAEADDFLPDHVDFPGELDHYLERVAALKASLSGDVRSHEPDPALAEVAAAALRTSSGDAG